jgi:hypothetical protein
MPRSLSHKTKQFFYTLIKVSIVIGSSYFIYNKLVHNDNLSFNVFIAFLIKNDLFLLKTVLFILFLSVFNLFLEILKWQNLLTFVKNTTFFEALKQSLAAHTIALFTPNRIGEYGAKAIYFTKPLRKRILLLNFIGNATQMGATLFFGVIGLILFINKYNITISFNTLLILLATAVVLITLLFFGLKLKRFTIRGVSLQGTLQFLLKIPIDIHIKTMAYSFIKYLIFSFQFYYLLRLFGVDLTYFNTMIIITTMYLLSSIVPSILIFDVIIKGSVALFLFSIVGVDDLTILSVTTLMWLLNFVLPSMLGSIFILNFDYKKTVNLSSYSK